MGTLYIKFKLGRNHFAHNYTETIHVASKPNLLKFQLGAGFVPMTYK